MLAHDGGEMSALGSLESRGGCHEALGVPARAPVVANEWDRIGTGGSRWCSGGRGRFWGGKDGLWAVATTSVNRGGRRGSGESVYYITANGLDKEISANTGSYVALAESGVGEAAKGAADAMARAAPRRQWVSPPRIGFFWGDRK